MSGKQEVIPEEVKEALGVEEKEPRFGDQINFNELFRVKTKKGLFCLGSEVNKARMVHMIGFLDFKNKCTVHADKLVCLGQFRFETEAGHDPLGMGDVFSNLFEFFEKTPKETPKLNDFVPNYDPSEFKERHALQVLGWFNEVITKMEEVNDKSKAPEEQD